MAAAPSDPCVLVIDDEQLILSFMNSALTEHGFRVRTYRSVKLALAGPDEASDPPDLALIDLRHGRPDFHTLRQRFPKLPIILMISNLEDGLENDLQHLDAYAILQKPFSLTAVLNVLRRARDAVADVPFTL